MKHNIRYSKLWFPFLKIWVSVGGQLAWHALTSLNDIAPCTLITDMFRGGSTEKTSWKGRCNVIKVWITDVFKHIAYIWIHRSTVTGLTSDKCSCFILSKVSSFNVWGIMVAVCIRCQNWDYTYKIWIDFFLSFWKNIVQRKQLTFGKAI